jgi:hypothetical protein
MPNYGIFGRAIHEVDAADRAGIIDEIRLRQTNATGLEGVAHEISQNEMRAALV